jgi:hyperosmotically inducible protein
MLGCDKPAQQVSAPPANALIEPSAPVTDRATATPRPTTVGTKIDDGVVTTKVKSALIADPDVKGLDIKVETRKGEVQLSGFVDSQAQVDRAVQIASGVEGVNAIDNKMSLKAGKATVGNTVDDSIVTAKVKTALVADSTVKSSDIAVVTRKGDVQLSGYVDNQSQIDRAIEVARGIDGVKKVENKMAVKK